MKNNREIYQAPNINGTYVLYPKALVELPEEEENLNAKSIIIINSTFLLYYRLGYISLEEMVNFLVELKYSNCGNSNTNLLVCLV